jgi:hypothetical protein
MQYVFGANRDKKGAQVLVMSDHPKNNFSYQRNASYKKIKFEDEMQFIVFENFITTQDKNCEILLVEAKNYKEAIKELQKLGYKYLPHSEKPKVFRTKKQIF